MDQNPHIRLSIASVELPDGTIRWIPLAEIPGLIADGLIVGAATIIGVQHVLLTAGQRAR